MTSQHPPRRPMVTGRIFFYGYIIVAVGFLVQILTWGTLNSYGVFFTPLMDEFGWTRAAISGGTSLSQIIIGVGAIALGNLTDRFGPRAVMTSAGTVAGLGYLLMSRMDSIWELYLFYGLVVGLGTSGTDVILLSTTARWFVKRRGMMTGIVKIGTGVGIMIMPLVTAWLISGYGWRNTYLVVGGIILVLVGLSSQFLHRDPARMGLLPDGTGTGIITNVRPAEPGLTLQDAFRSGKFWRLCLACLAILYCSMTILVHITPYVVDLGFSVSFGATMLSIIGGSSILGRLTMGIASDRVGSRRAFAVCFGLFIVVFIWLLVAKDLWALLLFAAVYGFSHGGCYTLLSPMVAEFFGMRAHGSLFGIVVFVSSVGGSLGPLVTGYIFDTTSSYQVAFLLLISMATVGLMLVLTAGSAPFRVDSRTGDDTGKIVTPHP